MKKYLFLFLVSCISLGTLAQVPQRESDREDTGRSSGGITRKFEKKGKKQKKPPISDYKIISYTRDTTYVDTTLSMKKYYKFNYLRKDNFELLPFSNTGRTYTSLAKVVEPNRLMPRFGARARHFNFMEVEDISYYEAPTPFSELFFKTVTEQGQEIDALFTINTSPQFNFSFEYKGLRSLGRYQHILASSGNFRTTVGYHTKNERYKLRMHFVAQNMMNEDNGGLEEEALESYVLGLNQGSRESDNRGSLQVNYEDLESLLKGKRFYLDQEYDIFKPSDSSTISNKLSIRHQMDLTDKSYTFDQDSPSEFFGDSFVTASIKDVVSLEDFTNEVSLIYQNEYLGRLSVSGIATNYNYGYNSILNKADGSRIINRILGDANAVGVEYRKRYKKLDLTLRGKKMLSSDFESSYLEGNIGYTLDQKNRVQLRASSSKSAPNYNFLLHQSKYINYNWQHDQFQHIARQTIALELQSSKLFDLDLEYSTLLNHTYFNASLFEEEDEEGELVAVSRVVPLQFQEQIGLLKVKWHRDLQVWKLGLDNTFMYQNVANGDGVYNVPEFITRSACYYHDEIFRKALYLQAGVTLKYFTAYTPDAYDPLLAEFYVQNTASIGATPLVDIFINAKVQQTRIFFKLENFNELFDQNTAFTAPGYPSRDFLLRFGLVWNFFL